MKNTIINTANGIFNKANEIKEKVGENISNTIDKGLDFIPDFSIDTVENKLEETGYKITRVEVEIGIPPMVTFEVDLNNSNIDDLKKEKLLEEDNNNIIEEMILNKIVQGIERAKKLDRKFDFKNKKLSSIEIDVTIKPAFRLIYTPGK